MSCSFKIAFVLLVGLKGSFSKLQEINCVLNNLQIEKTETKLNILPTLPVTTIFFWKLAVLKSRLGLC